MLARLSAFVIWALVAATAVFWGLRLLVNAPAAPTYAVPVDNAGAVRGDLTRLLGSVSVASVAAGPVADANSRFRLLGIMAPKSPAGTVDAYGVALIAVDGKMPRAFSVGSRLDGDMILQSVSLRTASIGPTQGAATLTLELPPLAPAATGKLPAGGSAGPAPQPVSPLVPQPMVPQPQQSQQQPVMPVPGLAPAPARQDSNSAPTQ
jgi:general secretion pathway protein C